MKKKVSLILVILFLNLSVSPPPANAIVTFDPTANKTLMAIWTKLTVMYTTIKAHLDTAVEMEEMMSDAHSTYQTISNLDISEIAADFQSGEILNGAGPFGKLGMLQLEIEDKVSAGEDHLDYAVAQKNRIQNLRRLAKLKAASFKNMGKASRDLKERDSGQITAQSTATLAALATLEENRKEKTAIAAAEAKNEEKKTIRRMGEIYTAMGKRQ
ncbi:MAG: hypothetical protein ACE5GK_12610 [Nitrospiria bacterium]